MGSYVLQQRNNPYVVNQLNEMELRSIIVSAVTIYSGLFFLTGDLGNDSQLLMFVVMLLSNVVFISYWGYFTFGFYIAKVYVKCNCCKRIFGKKLSHWVATVNPECATDEKTIENPTENAPVIDPNNSQPDDSPKHKILHKKSAWMKKGLFEYSKL